MQTSKSSVKGPKHVARDRVFYPEYGFTFDVVDAHKEKIEFRRDSESSVPVLIAYRTGYEFNDLNHAVCFQVLLPKLPQQLAAITYESCQQAAEYYFGRYLHEEEPEGFQMLNEMAWLPFIPEPEFEQQTEKAIWGKELILTDQQIKALSEGTAISQIALSKRS